MYGNDDFWQQAQIDQVHTYFMEKHRQFIQHHMDQHNPLASANENGANESADHTYNENSGLSQLALVAANAAMSDESDNAPVNSGQIEPLRKRRSNSRKPNPKSEPQQKHRKPLITFITIQELLISCNLSMYTETFMEQGFDSVEALLKQSDHEQTQMLEWIGMTKPGHIQRFLSTITNMKNI